MRFSLFYEMQISQPDRTSELRLFHECVEQVVLADSLGYHAAWVVEHHGLHEYSHSSAPEIFLAFVAAKTARIRLGHGVTLTPYRYNHPIRIAERVATLDLLSEGRVDWGSGKSASLTEQLAFENNIAELHGQWLEALDMIPRMWQQDVFEYIGQYFDIPPVRIIPKPLQKPHPPIFAACSRPESAEKVGHLGIGALNFALGNEAQIRENVDAYRRAVTASQPKHYQKNNSFACTPPTLCLDDDMKACRYGERGARFFNQSLSFYYLSGKRNIGPVPSNREFLPDSKLEKVMGLRGSEEALGLPVYGDPIHCREIVSRYVSAGVDELILIMQLGTVPHDLVMESIKTFAERVIPFVSS
jgi:alkanesulfonate monooxygenase SsuD/methylene tetrahydromethanopterin reductase-like flavin-dependent oxidoreductase (luciferase family)